MFLKNIFPLDKFLFANKSQQPFPTAQVNSNSFKIYGLVTLKTGNKARKATRRLAKGRTR